MKNLSKKLKFVFQLAKTNAVLARRFSSQGLGFGDIAVMFAISRAPEGKIRRVDLADQLGLTASGVTRMLLPLEKIGVIKRELNARDARVSFATLTTAGKRLLGESLESAELLCDDLIPEDKVKNLDELSAILVNIADA
jgi:DNA-binding MarR family transcriptional regulator